MKTTTTTTTASSTISTTSTTSTTTTTATVVPAIVGETPLQITKGNLLATIPKHGPHFEISFDVKVESWIGAWGSIVRFASLDDNSGSVGARIPAVWTHVSKKDYLHVCTAIGSSGNSCKDIKTPGPNKWFNVILSQVIECPSLIIYRMFGFRIQPPSISCLTRS